MSTAAYVFRNVTIASAERGGAARESAAAGTLGASPKPRISVVVCTYNGARYVRAQLESIFNQTTPPDEVIISDDVSSDDTLDVIRQVTAGQSPVVRVLENTANARVNGNFEKAIAHATGEFIFTSDQDDVWLPNRIARMIQPMLDDANVGLVYCNALVTDASLEPVGQPLFASLSHFRIGRRRSAPEVLRGVEVRGCTMAFRASLKQYVLPIPESRYWGWDYWIVLLASALGDVYPVAEPLMYYRRHSDNRSPLHWGWLADMKGGLSSAGADVYVRDIGRWTVARERLRHILLSPVLTTEQRASVCHFLPHVERCLKLAVTREQLKRRARPLRVVCALLPLVGGDYHRYKRGLKTLLKDVVIR